MSSALVLVEVIIMDFNRPVSVFEKRYKSERDVRAKVRLHVLLLRRQKYTQPEIAGIVKITQGTVSNVCRRFLKEGWSSVYDKPREGRPAQLTKTQKQLLKKSMQEEIIDGKICRGWQTKDVCSFLKKEFNMTYTVQHTRRIMHDLGMSWKVPRPEHKNRDEKAVRAFKKTSRGRPSLWRPITQSSASMKHISDETLTKDDAGVR